MTLEEMNKELLEEVTSLRNQNLNLSKKNKELKKQLTIPNVSQLRELLLAFFDLSDELPMGLSNYDREKIVEEFLANNCA